MLGGSWKVKEGDKDELCAVCMLLLLCCVSLQRFSAKASSPQAMPALPAVGMTIRQVPQHSRTSPTAVCTSPVPRELRSQLCAQPASMVQRHHTRPAVPQFQSQLQQARLVLMLQNFNISTYSLCPPSPCVVTSKYCNVLFLPPGCN